MNPRRITLAEAVTIVDGAMVTGAITDEAREAWQVVRGDARRRPTASGVLREVTAELQRGRVGAGLEDR